MKIEIIYAKPHQTNIMQCDVPDACTIEQALIHSQFLSTYSIDFPVKNVGVFGQVLALNHPLQDGDRLEIYRPLLADPKEIRRRRAQQQK